MNAVKETCDYSKAENLIITSQDKAHRNRCLFCHILSVPFWVIFIYTLIPLFVLLCHPSGSNRFLLLLPKLDIIPALEIIRFCLILILVLILMYSSWGHYNKTKYGGKFNKRVHSSPYATTRDLAREFRVPENRLETWQKGRIRVLTFDDHENVIAITSKPTVSPATAASILNLAPDAAWSGILSPSENASSVPKGV